MHIDRRDVMNDGPDKGATINDHFLSKKTSAHKGNFLCGSPIKPLHHPIDDGDRDDEENEC